MQTRPRNAKTAPMSADAYAGFLKLWLTPANRVPESTPEVRAYLRYANEREPLPETALHAIGQPTDQAA